MDMNTNPKVLFIAGAGRSGSTILDMLLGQITGFYSVGEVRYIWDRGLRENQLCGCGQPFRDCEFWTSVIRDAFGTEQNVDYERLASLRKIAESQFRPLKRIVARKAPSPGGSMDEYRNALGALYRSIQKVSGCHTIVDSSKMVNHGFVLGKNVDVDLLTLHLVRDSRAVAYSWRREKLKPEIYWEKRRMGQRRYVRSIERWMTLNIMAHRLREISQKYSFLKYENLAEEPKKVLSKLLTEFDYKDICLDFIDGSTANINSSHTVSGNPVRFSQGPISITPDLKWRTEMPKRHIWLITMLTWPLLLKYDYLK